MDFEKLAQGADLLDGLEEMAGMMPEIPRDSIAFMNTIGQQSTAMFFVHMLARETGEPTPGTCCIVHAREAIAAYAQKLDKALEAGERQKATLILCNMMAVAMSVVHAMEDEVDG